MIKAHGPNPLDYLALKYSQDGKKVEVLEAVDGVWNTFSKIPMYTLKDVAPTDHWGKILSLSAIGKKNYCWIADDGYNQFANWVA